MLETFALAAPRPRLLLVSMYPLDQGMWGPTVRISHLRDELAQLVDLDLVSGYRGARRRQLWRYALSGRLRGLDGIYVECSSFLPAETDVAFLGLARTLGIRVLTYIRDAYQLFPDYRDAGSLRRRIGARAFLPAMRALGAVSSTLAFPTRGLARAVIGDAADAAEVLPPGSPEPVDVPRSPTANRLLFVGSARLPAHGMDSLIEAVGRTRRGGVDLRLAVVSRPGEEPAAPHPDWVEVSHAEGAGIHTLLPDVVATVIPRPRSAYNDLAVPIKIMEYLSYGRPLVVTDCTELARIVTDADAGIVVGDTADEMVAGFQRLAAAPPAELDAWSANAHEAARRNSWAARARDILRALESGAPG